MRTPQLTEQYGQVDRVSVARDILSSFSCATAGVRSNPRREKPAPPTSAPLIKFLRESSIAPPLTTFDQRLNGLDRRTGTATGLNLRLPSFRFLIRFIVSAANIFPATGLQAPNFHKL